MPIIINPNNPNIRYSADVIPNECPICHRAIEPSIIAVVQTEENLLTDAVFLCKGCFNLFIAKYRHVGSGNWSFAHSWPILPQQVKQPKELQRLSPSFCEVYNQAIASESYKLHQLTGIGLRKSLEYLVKDYLIFLNPDESEQIKKIPLSQCLTETHIQNKRLIEVAKRAMWLGNDEVHYDKKWENRDLQDLKNLINITKEWITSEIMAINYINEMDTPKK